MESPTRPATVTAPIPEELLKHLPARVHGSYRRFLATGDMVAADEVVIAVVKDHVPATKVDRIPTTLTDKSTLMGDLGIDSVAIADAVFVLEDVFNVSISNKDIMRVRSVGDLRMFIRSKLTTHESN